ncbi:hypothetical protein Tco_0938607 [Tanacetum coccineum]|uniref:ABC transmembrane type-1 domain-containing protein n=1 Tax=Tanacetum coccineum TaxID=301880 RepID=A0ABQ5DIA4_9ASTR
MVTSSLLSVQLVVVAYKEVMEVLVRCWSDGDVVPTSVPALQDMDTGCRLFIAAGPLFLQFLGASFTQGMVSSIPIVGSISPEGFLPPILLLVVIIVIVVIVAVILVVVVVAIVGVVIVVASFG